MNHNFKSLTDDVMVSPQISLSQIDSIIASGIKTVVCHRPDSELSSVEPDHTQVEDALAQHGIAFFYQPVQQLAQPDIQQFATLLREQSAPLLAYCASGTRSTLLWALSQVLIENQSRDDVVKSAYAAGYDIAQYLG